MTDNDFQQTKRVLLGQESMNKEYAQLADFIQERFSVQVINVICAKGEDSINLTLWFKYENEVNYFYKGRFVVDSRKRNTILNKFKQIANIENKADSIYLSYQAFETLAKEEANNSITQLEILELKEKLHCNDLWDISRCLANVVFFFHLFLRIMFGSVPPIQSVCCLLASSEIHKRIIFHIIVQRINIVIN